MRKFKVIRLIGPDTFIGLKIGDIVEETKYRSDDHILCRLPKSLRGKGHNGNIFNNTKYTTDNYWYFLSMDLEEIICQ
jgi:hypothetical protein